MASYVYKYRALKADYGCLLKKFKKEKKKNQLLEEEVSVQKQVIGQLKSLLSQSQTKPRCLLGHRECLIDHVKFNFFKKTDDHPKMTVKMESSRIKSPLDVNPTLDTKKLLPQDATSFVVTVSKKIDCLQSKYGLPLSFRNIKSEKINLDIANAEKCNQSKIKPAKPDTMPCLRLRTSSHAQFSKDVYDAHECVLSEKVVDVYDMPKNQVLNSLQYDALDGKLPFSLLDDVCDAAVNNDRLDIGGKYTSPVLMFDIKRKEDNQMDGCGLDDLDMKGEGWKVMEVQAMLDAMDESKYEADDHGLQVYGNGVADNDVDGEVTAVADKSYPGSHWDYYTALSYAAWAVRG